MKHLFTVLLLILCTANSYSQTGISHDWQRQAHSLGVTKNDLIPGEKNPAFAFLLGLSAPGLGQMYNEDVGLGFGVLIGTGIIMGASTKVDSDMQDKVMLIGAIAWLSFAVAATIRSQNINYESRTKRAIIEKLRNKDNASMLDNLQIQPYYDGKSGGLSLSYSW